MEKPQRRRGTEILKEGADSLMNYVDTINRPRLAANVLRRPRGFRLLRLSQTRLRLRVLRIEAQCCFKLRDRVIRPTEPAIGIAKVDVRLEIIRSDLQRGLIFGDRFRQSASRE